MKRKLLTFVNIIKGIFIEGSIQGIKVIGKILKRIARVIKQQGSKNNKEVMKRIDWKDGWDDEDNSSILVESFTISLSCI